VKKLIAISFLLVFSMLQYGKLVSYIYCELRVDVSANGVANCDCEKFLTEKKADEPVSPLSHSHNYKEKLNEPYTLYATDNSAENTEINTSCFSYYLTDLRSGFTQPPYHPPAITS
jgi:hypothetical protein